MTSNGLSAQPIIIHTVSQNNGPWDLHQPNSGGYLGTLPGCWNRLWGWNYQPSEILFVERLRKPQLSFPWVSRGLIFFSSSACSHGRSHLGILVVYHLVDVYACQALGSDDIPFRPRAQGLLHDRLHESWNDVARLYEHPLKFATT